MTPKTRFNEMEQEFDNSELDKLKYVLQVFLRVRKHDDIRTFVSQQKIISVGDLIAHVNASNWGRHLRVKRNGVEVPFKDPQRGKLVQLSNFERYTGLQSKEGYFVDWKLYDYVDFNKFRSRRLRESEIPPIIPRTISKTQVPKVVLTNFELDNEVIKEVIKENPDASFIPEQDNLFGTLENGEGSEIVAQEPSDFTVSDKRDSLNIEEEIVKVENCFVQDFLEKLQVENSLNDILNHLFPSKLFNICNEGKENFIQFALSSKTIVNKENLDFGNDCLQFRLCFVKEIDKTFKVKTSKFFNDPLKHSSQ